MRPLPASLAVAFAAAIASPSAFVMDCAFSRAETPDIDLAGVERVEVAIGPDRIALSPTTGANAPALSIRHCASSEDLLAKSAVPVERRGDTLVIRAQALEVQVFNLFGHDRYSWRDMTLALPADRRVALDVGSGDASVDGMGDVTLDLGSGDVVLREVGRVDADVGSGDLAIEGATAVAVDVGSGDAVLKHVQGQVDASVGSGDVEMTDVGPLASLSAGSGAIRADGVRGDARVRSVGSGDVTLRVVRGAVRVDDVGSGEVDVQDVGGDVIVSNKDTLDSVETRGIAGRIIVGG